MLLCPIIPVVVRLISLIKEGHTKVEAENRTTTTTNTMQEEGDDDDEGGTGNLVAELPLAYQLFRVVKDCGAKGITQTVQRNTLLLNEHLPLQLTRDGAWLFGTKKRKSFGSRHWGPSTP